MVRVLCVLHQCHHWWVRLYMLCLLGPGCVCVFGACCTRFPGDDDQCVIENDADGGREGMAQGKEEPLSAFRFFFPDRIHKNSYDSRAITLHTLFLLLLDVLVLVDARALSGGKRNHHDNHNRARRSSWRDSKGGGATTTTTCWCATAATTSAEVPHIRKARPKLQRGGGTTATATAAAEARRQQKRLAGRAHAARRGNAEAANGCGEQPGAGHKRNHQHAYANTHVHIRAAAAAQNAGWYHGNHDDARGAVYTRHDEQVRLQPGPSHAQIPRPR